MAQSLEDLTLHLLARVRLIQANLGGDADKTENGDARLADLLDSMAMIEFLALVASECDNTPEAILACVGGQLGTVRELAKALLAAGIRPRDQSASAGLGHPAITPRPSLSTTTGCWLAATAVFLPKIVQSAVEIGRVLQRPAAWLESHAGIKNRCLWADQDPLQAAADAGAECLRQAGVASNRLGMLIVTSEAPPLLVGLGAALHHCLRLPQATPVLEVGGACTGFLAVLWAAQRLLTQLNTVLVVAVEAPSRLLELKPGPAGEAAALFGDAAAAALLCREPTGAQAVRFAEITLHVDGSAGHLLRVKRSQDSGFALTMDGTAVASRAVRVMAQSVRDLAGRHGLDVRDLAAVVAHGGNGRMPGLLARQLGLSPDRVWSETRTTGNLGSASLPVAWAAHQPAPAGPMIWTAVGAGFVWGAALTRVGSATPPSELDG